MAPPLKTFTINLKSMDQEMGSPVIAGAGDVNGYTLRIVFEQQAACQLTPQTKVYLSWFHQESRIRGYNVLTKTSDCPAIWEMHWPKPMLREGNALCRLELVDDISITPSNNFTVHILQNPNDGSGFIDSDGYSDFEQAVLDLNNLSDEMRDDLMSHRDAMNDMMEEVSALKENAESVLNSVVTNTMNLYMNEI